MGKRASFLVGLGLFFPLLSGGVCVHTTLCSGEVRGQEQALRGRVEELYSLMQVGKWTQAERYVTEDAREAFRDQSNKPFLSFQVESIKLDPNGQSATVVVRLLVMAQIAPMPIRFPRTSRWRLVDGVWYIEVPKPDSKAVKSVFEGGLDRSSSPANLASEELKFKGHRYRLATIQPGEVKTARFPFTNASGHIVTLSQVLTGCECLRVKTEKKVYKPGESGELVIEFDPTNYEREYDQTVIVKTEPGNLTTYLNINGYVIPRPREAPQPGGENKPVRKP